MILFCPKCGVTPDDKDVSRAAGMANCASCGEVWSFDAAVAPVPTSGPATAPRLGSGPPAAFRAARIGMSLFHMGFMVVWTGMAASFMVIGYNAQFWPFFAMATLFVCVGIAWFVGAALTLVKELRGA